MSKVRVRFAPSPTGPLHIGGVRTALFNYLFAKKHGGDFILRIEDTDQTRFVEGAQEYIEESLKWASLIVDEGIKQGGKYGPYKQSERRDIYKKYANILIENGWGYYAFDTAEKLDSLRQEAEANKSVFTYGPNTRANLKNSLNLSKEEVDELINKNTAYVIRFKTPKNEEIIMQDIIRGEVRVNTSTLDDKVLFKSDGLPTYHLANVVDDHLMKISHVIRGEEWLPSLALHFMLYKALGWENEMPKFAHLPLILKPTGNGKLSKRDGDKMGFPVFPINWNVPNSDDIYKGYREDGYFPEAFVNMLAFLGWNPGDEREIMQLNELINEFSLEKVSKSGARFDPDKAKWYNHQWMQKLPIATIVNEFKIILAEKSINASEQKITKIVEMVRERSNFVSELWNNSYFFFQAPTEYDAKTVKKKWKQDSPELMVSVKNILSEISNFNRDTAHNAVVAYIEKNELGMGKVMNALRLCIVGAGAGPDLFSIIEMIGKDETVKRINLAIENIKK